MAAQGTDLVVVERGGVLYKLTATELAALGGGGGGGLTQGMATLNFGVFPGSNTASVTITGLAGITAGSKPKAYINASATTSDHTANDHKYLACFVGLACGDVVPAASFTIYATSLEKLQGQWSVTYEY